ncbi:MAG: ATP-binding cassette domain-containing protein [bacterium]
MDALIKVDKLGKYFGQIKAVDCISFEVAKGEVLGFLGPNGAGKTTTMKMLTGFLSPTFGKAWVSGLDVEEHSKEIRKRIGYLSENAPLYNEMQVGSFLRFIGEVRGIEKEELPERIRKVAGITAIDKVLRQEIRTLSKGYRRRVALAQTLLHDPEILILDEPTDGLDPNQKYEVRNLIKEMAKNKCIIISTHILEEVEAICTRAIIIAKGKIVSDERPDELAKKSKGYGTIYITIKTKEEKDYLKILEQARDVKSVKIISTDDDEVKYEVIPIGGKRIIPDIAHLAYERKWKVEELTMNTGDINQTFREITL